MSAEEKNALLIVDDEELNRAILANIFQADYDILEAEDGQQALELIEGTSRPLSAILLDVVMPRLDGIQLLRILNERKLTSVVPVFLITADPGDDTMQKAYDLGVMDVIAKPVVPFVVRRRVQSVVELFAARRLLGAEVERQRDQLLFQAEQLAEMSMGMVEALSTAIEFSSDESGEHVRRIHDITCMLLGETPLGDGLSDSEIRLIGMGAVTHDVGKISIPDAILNKKGRLTPDEYELMKTHTTQGAQLLSHIPQMREHSAYRYAYDIALHHHERWDGGGYPEGLKGDEISMWTQVVSLIDVYDALVSERCYKKPIPFDRATEMILDGECGVFNPRMLEYFRKAEPWMRQLYKKEESSRSWVK
ncbi:HD domain-containing phosphohydrolase [Angelakisella massiliensis]|uniref:HD-GYP domain-containing protein n=1 Tax=Angelakisella massiliensis TaxID=1871018 RepID=UPI0024B24E0D|nr:HD domain-containing phosphohydrolase [Angelakisella massiliensis]